MSILLPELKSSPVIKRVHAGEPVLCAKDMPYEAECIFNVGVVKYRNPYVMAFRNDYDYNGKGGFRKCFVGLAFSDDGIKWNVNKEPFLTAADMHDPDVTRVYDHRLIVIDDMCCLCFAVDTRHGVRGGIAVTKDLKSIEV